ncbi:MAG: hypothetical protein NC350_03290 [Corallococcus sp.]|nr:hypothetical protein [Corallococcus sp.]
MTDYSKCVIDDTVKIGKNVNIEPFCVILGNTQIGDDSTIESFSYLVNARIGKNTVVRSSRICDSTVGDGCSIGPNAHLRQNATVNDNCRVGNFVEIKNSTLGEKTKASHLAYIGDADIGKNCNIGCGVIFVNYDGREKHHTAVGDNCFIGCNSNLVAPVTVGDNCFVACGATVDRDIPTNSFSIGRSKISVKENYAQKYLKKD